MSKKSLIRVMKQNKVWALFSKMKRDAKGNPTIPLYNILGPRRMKRVRKV